MVLAFDIEHDPLPPLRPKPACIVVIRPPIGALTKAWMKNEFLHLGIAQDCQAMGCPGAPVFFPCGENLLGPDRVARPGADRETADSP